MYQKYTNKWILGGMTVALSEYFQKGKVGEQACQPYHKAQFGDPSPKATTIGKSKTLWQGSSSVDKYILQFKAKASQTDLGYTVLVEYLKAGLNPTLFKSIYWLPVMPETLKEWYEWAQKLD